MIAGFDTETKHLDAYEQSTVLPRIVSGLSVLGKAGKCLSSSKIIDRLKAEGITVTGPRLRKIINHIRINHLVRGVVADDKGYAVVQDPNLILEYLDGLDSRIEAIQAMRNALYEDYQFFARTLFSEPQPNIEGFKAANPIHNEPTPVKQAVDRWLAENQEA